MERLPALEAAARLIEEQFPMCSGALLAGSVVRGEATATSDLDLVIFEEGLSDSYRSSIRFDGWDVELFVHNLESYTAFFKSDTERAKPSLARMITEGWVIRDSEALHRIKAEATLVLSAGPPRWTDEMLTQKRYIVSDLLEDFIGTQRRSEGLFVASDLMWHAGEFILRANGQWTGSSKWMERALRAYSSELADRFTGAFDRFYTAGEKDQVIGLVDDLLLPFGGRLFEGYSIGKGAERDADSLS
ncbi:nucleotidyltransferase domain-containing protein [Exiguobacterium flavidum]|uniref:nucleotidyltransferase domain-containing protein n=1 Tax=Exiguobacterium flavidum TaxID=2184695 RepID=UPI000DF8161B|nr:nucleotidyltransferase domain-containing protein [Exiguobacterium flavidum]